MTMSRSSILPWKERWLQREPICIAVAIITGWLLDSTKISQSGSVMVLWERLAQHYGLLQEHRQKHHFLELEVSPRVNIIQLLDKILPAQKLQ